MEEFNKALIEYRNAVAKRAFWTNHGSHGDGRLEAAKAAEAKALRQVKACAKLMASA